MFFAIAGPTTERFLHRGVARKSVRLWGFGDLLWNEPASDFSAVGVHTTNIVGLAQSIEQFAQEHAVEIGTARASWDQSVAKAKELGYVGQVGSLG
ncbi:MAG: hypothetical protein ACRCYU_02715 [Nocardioides sp.]